MRIELSGFIAQRGLGDMTAHGGATNMRSIRKSH
jgi:hypothetical protein